ncbi:MAG TPA: hypothetical protein VD763_05710 [Candidatus Saccharimonadales bacterium]|nr:hypothetical protein [Candidatus Saccharimonadales bacterium]
MDLVPLVAIATTVTLAIGFGVLGLLVAIGPDDEADLVAFASDRDDLPDVGHAV